MTTHPQPQRRNLVLITVWTLFSALTPLGIFAGDWGDPDLGSLVLWKDGNAARVVELSPSMQERQSAAFLQPPGWDAVGVAGNKLLWTWGNGGISIWTLDNNLNVVATNDLQGPSGYSATSSALALQNPIACWEDDEDYYVLFDHNQGTQDSIVWLVGSNGQFRRQNSFGRKAGYRAVHFGMSANGYMKMVWARDDGHAVLWKVDWSSFENNWIYTGENDYQARLGTVVTGFATSIDQQGTPFDQVLMSSFGGFLTLLVLDAQGNGRELIDHFPGGPWIAGAFSNTRPDCSPPIIFIPIPWEPPIVEPIPFVPPVLTLIYSFRRGDADVSGAADMTDAINRLESLMLGRFTIPTPDPQRCGQDPTADFMICADYEGC